MNLKQYRQKYGAEGWERLADRAGTKVSYFIQIAGGHAAPSAKMCRKLQIASDHEVTCEELRPDLFGPIDEVA